MRNRLCSMMAKAAELNEHPYTRTESHGVTDHHDITFKFQVIFIFSPTQHNNVFITCIVTATCFGIFYRPSSVNTLHKTQVCIPQNTCVLCNVFPDDGLQKRPKHVAPVIYKINILLCLMGGNKNISWNTTAWRDKFYQVFYVFMLQDKIWKKNS